MVRGFATNVVPIMYASTVPNHELTRIDLIKKNNFIRQPAARTDCRGTDSPLARRNFFSQDVVRSYSVLLERVLRA